MPSRFQHFFGAARHPLISIDRHGLVAECNEAAAEYFDSPADTHPSIPVWECVHPEDVAALREGIAHVFETLRAVNLRFRVQDRTGRWRTLDAVMQLIGTDTTLVSVSAIDVTPPSVDSADDETWRQIAALETLGRVAGGVSHDFANLLMVISGESTRVLDALEDDSPLARHLNTIRTAADRATSMVRHLLSMSRPHADSATVLDLSDVVNGMRDIIHRLVGEPITVDVVAETPCWPVSGHRVQIERVLLNLAVNARDAMPEGGRLTITAHNISGAALADAGITAVDGAVAISVTDTGVGMDAETAARAFEPFFTTKAGHGTGLGLATVKSVVADAGGWTQVKSELGRGTTISVLLPRLHAVPETEVRVPAAVVGGTETILVVEDEPGVLDVVRDMLESAGYHVLAGCTAAAVDEILGSHHGPIHLLLSDVVLPDVNGLDLAARVRSRHPELPVLFMSGYAEPAFSDGRAGTLEHSFISKPFDRQKLLHAVRKAIESVSLAPAYVQREPAVG